jgi:hypothetical protein
VRVVPTDEWNALVTRLQGRDTYTLAAYHRAAATLEPAGTQPVLLHFAHSGGDVALPLLLRPLPDGHGWDATSAYGYGGPVAASERAATGLLEALDAWAAANDVVATFLRLHPLLGNARLIPRSAELIELGSTVAWDVSPGRDLVTVMHPHHQRAVRKADRTGVTVDVLNHPRDLGPFCDLYETTMRRQQADDFYFLTAGYWKSVLDEAEELGLVLVEARLDGELIAALLCFATGPWLHYHLGATSDRGRSIGASARCFLAAAEWAQSRDLARFHLGGGLGGNPDSPLLRFKHRFDPAGALLPFHVVKLVHHADRYEALAGTSSTAGFFPPWRREG